MLSYYVNQTYRLNPVVILMSESFLEPTTTYQTRKEICTKHILVFVDGKQYDTEQLTHSSSHSISNKRAVCAQG